MSNAIIAKKSLGQHFLNDENVCHKIIHFLEESIKTTDTTYILEVGAGTGALTNYLLKIPDINFIAVEVDAEKSGVP